MDRLEYDFDASGRLVAEVDGEGRRHTFEYDRLGRLVRESHPDFGTISYGYDNNGNRRTQTTVGDGGTRTEQYRYDGGERLLWTNEAGEFAPTSGQATPSTPSSATT